jgi:hypothetical protein
VLLFLQAADGVFYLTALGQSALTVELVDPVDPTGPTDAIVANTSSAGGAAQALPSGRVYRDLRGMTFYGLTEDGPGLFSVDEVEATTLEHLRELATSWEGGSR